MIMMITSTNVDNDSINDDSNDNGNNDDGNNDDNNVDDDNNDNNNNNNGNDHNDNDNGVNRMLEIPPLQALSLHLDYLTILLNFDFTTIDDTMFLDISFSFFPRN
ncbi:hypothetical protein LOAG_10692 [Loa loa]|uniref:Uncharacterized protein n=1 Tax=Loa loa TaxID=7209 RepID=A0A1S0TPZ3_LOALO|nr:hypothetical protein LOAG_10692 [Loa loa]EFO17807.1 hypothetical protein LOAG_10692 [Loa loa]